MNKKFLYAAMYASVAFASDNQASRTDNTAEQQKNNTAMSLARTQNTTDSTKQLQKILDNSKVVDKQKNNASISFAKNQKKKDNHEQRLQDMLNQNKTYTNLTSVSCTQNTPGDAKHIEYEHTSVLPLSKTTAEKDITVPTVASVTSPEEDALDVELPETQEEALTEHTQSVPSAEDVNAGIIRHDADVQCEDTATDQPEEIRAIIAQCVREQLKAIQQEFTEKAIQQEFTEKAIQQEFTEEDTESSEGPSAESVILYTIQELLMGAASEKVAYSICEKLQENTTIQYNDTATEGPIETQIEEPYTAEGLFATTKEDELRQKRYALTKIETEIASTNEEIACKDPELRTIQATLAEKKDRLEKAQRELSTITEKMSVITALSSNMKELQKLTNDTVSQIISAIRKHAPEPYINAHVGESIPMKDLVRWFQSPAPQKNAIATKAYQHAEENCQKKLSQFFGDTINVQMFVLKYAETFERAISIVSEKNGINKILETLQTLNISRHDNDQTDDAEGKYMDEIITSLEACATKISALQQDVEKITKQYEEDQQAAGPDGKEEMLNEIAQNNPDLLVKVLNDRTDVLERYLEAQLQRDNGTAAQILLGLISGQIMNWAQRGMESEPRPHDE